MSKKKNKKQRELNKDNLQRLIAHLSNREVLFNWAVPGHCLSDLCDEFLREDDVSYNRFVSNPIEIFLNIPMDQALNLYIGRTIDGQSLVNFEIGFNIINEAAAAGKPSRSWEASREIAIAYLMSLLNKTNEQNNENVS